MDRKHNPKLTSNAKTLRRNMTKEERHLWYDFLRTYPVRFLRQKVIDDYIVDFYCHEARLIIELDGSQHYEEKSLLKDKVRTERIETRNLIVIRIPNIEINRNFRGVCEYIDWMVKERVEENPPVRTSGSASPFAKAATLLSLRDISPNRGISFRQGGLL